MNKIFKKIWNIRRSCFVAVSEAMTSACQKGGKSVIVGSLAFLSLLMGPEAFTAEIYNGFDVANDGSGHENKKYFLPTPNIIVNGDFTCYTRLPFYMSPTFEWGESTVQVNGNTYISPKSIVSYPEETDFNLARIHNSDYEKGVFSIRDNLVINRNGGISGGNFYQNTRGTGIAILTVGGTTSVDTGSYVRGAEAKVKGQIAQVSHTLNILNLKGNYFAATVGTGRNEYIRRITTGNLLGGNFYQNSVSDGWDTVHFSNLNLNSGTFALSDGLIIGGEVVNRVTVGNTLNLNGATVTNRNSLVQNQGTINVNASYDFSNYVLNNGTLNNNSFLTLTNLTLNGGSLLNSHTLTMRGIANTNGRLALQHVINNQGTWNDNTNLVFNGTINNSGIANIGGAWTFNVGSKLNSSGSITTQHGNIFDSLGTTGDQALKYVGLNSSVPQEVKTSLNAFFQKYVPGSVAKTLAQHASFSGGKVVITGVNITETQRDDLAKAFKSQLFILSNNSESAIS